MYIQNWFLGAFFKPGFKLFQGFAVFIKFPSKQTPLRQTVPADSQGRRGSKRRKHQRMQEGENRCDWKRIKEMTGRKKQEVTDGELETAKTDIWHVRKLPASVNRRQQAINRDWGRQLCKEEQRAGKSWKDSFVYRFQFFVWRSHTPPSLTRAYSSLVLIDQYDTLKVSAALF